MNEPLPDKTDKNAMIEALTQAGATFARGGAIHCPFHYNIKTPAGSIYKDDKGVYRFKCHSQCGTIGDVYDVRARAMNMSTEDYLRHLRERQKPTPVMSQRSVAPPPPLGDDVEVGAESTESNGFANLTELINYFKYSQLLIYQDHYLYRNPDTGNVDLVVIRFLIPSTKKKTFRQGHMNDGIYHIGKPPWAFPLYNRKAMLDADTVVLVEGEKDVITLHKLGIVATTSPGGAKNVAHTDWSPLAGKKVVVWPDNDEPGQQYADAAVDILRQLLPKVSLCMMPVAKMELPPKGDVTDFVESISEDKRVVVRETIDSLAEPMTYAGEIQRLLTSTIQGERYAIEFPFAYLTEFTHALKPGTITLVCGDPGSSKSIFLLQCLQYWNFKSYRACVMELEENREFHLMRALAQGVGNSDILTEGWVQKNADYIQELYRENEAYLNSFGEYIHDDAGKQYSLPDMVQWVEERCKEGYEIICVDPITATDTPGKPWEEANKFMRQCERLMKKYGARLIVVTHPKKGGGRFQTMDDIAGGAAFSRLAQSILWLENVVHKKRIYIAESEIPVEANRIFHLQKCRNSYGGGYSLAYNFDNKSLQFKELGLIDVSKKERRKNYTKKGE